jgi:hypothetical protein
MNLDKVPLLAFKICMGIFFYVIIYKGQNILQQKEISFSKDHKY